MKNSPIHPSLVKKSESPFGVILIGLVGIILSIVMSSCSQQAIPCPSHVSVMHKKQAPKNTYGKKYVKKMNKKSINLFASLK
jgi:hypothetical protein